jgi:hypothetical protein
VWARAHRDAGCQPPGPAPLLASRSGGVDAWAGGTGPYDPAPLRSVQVPVPLVAERLGGVGRAEGVRRVRGLRVIYLGS